MLNIIKKVFYNSDKETIRIFERATKIEYEPNIFRALKVLSISYTNLQNLNPLRVFKNLEILNLSHNKIQDIEPLKDLKNIKILDLRFNKIRRLPSWIFKTDKDIYWERTNSNQEGIFLEGNPLDKELILKISKNQAERRKKREQKRERENSKLQPIEKKPLTQQKNFKKPILKTKNSIKTEQKVKKSFQIPAVEQLIPLNRQQITIFKLKGFKSDFINHFTEQTNSKNSNKLKINTTIVEYIEERDKISFQSNPPKDLKYTILLLNETKCCLYPPILKNIFERYRDIEVFLIIEDNTKKEEIKSRIEFLRDYNRFKNVVDIFHSANKTDREYIKKSIYKYLDNTTEVNSLWKNSWITLRDEIEKKGILNRREFESLAGNYKLSKKVSNYIFEYLVKVGTLSPS